MGSGLLYLPSPQTVRTQKRDLCRLLSFSKGAYIGLHVSGQRVIEFRVGPSALNPTNRCRYKGVPLAMHSSRRFPRRHAVPLVFPGHKTTSRNILADFGAPLKD